MCSFQTWADIITLYFVKVNIGKLIYILFMNKIKNLHHGILNAM